MESSLKYNQFSPRAVNQAKQLCIFTDKQFSDTGDRIPSVLVILYLFFMYTSVLLILSNVYITDVYADVNPVNAEQPKPTETSEKDNPLAFSKPGDQTKKTTIEPLNYNLLLAAILIALVYGIVRLIKVFNPFLGLGCLTNKFSLLFLLFIVVATILSYIGLVIPDEWIDAEWYETVTSFLGEESAVIGAPIVGNLSTFFARIFSGKNLSTGEMKNVKGSIKSKGMGFLFDNIRTEIKDRLNIKILQFSKEYKWDEIKTVCGRLIDTEVAFNQLSTEEGEKRKKFIHGFNKSDDKLEDINNKHTVLCQTIQVIYYRRLASGLKSIRIHAQTS